MPAKYEAALLRLNERANKYVPIAAIVNVTTYPRL